jgi:hypothetical protein
MQRDGVDRLVIEALAEENVDLRDALKAIEADRDTYRLLAQIAIGEVARLTTITERQRERIGELAVRRSADEAMAA